LASATVVREKAAGIDIEDISNFPVVIDFREDDFYVSNFSMQEISYCILKGKPLGSFAGLFSTKEALCKTSERIRQMPFNKIEITHDDNGKPVYPGYSISISHTDQFAVAIAIANEADGQHIPANSEVVNSPGRYERKIARLNKMVLLALSIAVASAIVSILLLNRPA
jgi:phosphopantetheine--protein transferase-like protein